ncbi:hypothetical protein [Dyella terrae]|uniref:hypothetical protein n=1 Tax=Dyella terrae TaxID=522259 RepID=UPI001EFC9BC1|nr:hypothetical protein [Dyella terrae]ULU26813.1 hypothetical protein DYST_03761 [Dyella terrae]
MALCRQDTLFLTLWLGWWRNAKQWLAFLYLLLDAHFKVMPIQKKDGKDEHVLAMLPFRDASDETVSGFLVSGHIGVPRHLVGEIQLRPVVPVMAVTRKHIASAT